MNFRFQFYLLFAMAGLSLPLSAPSAAESGQIFPTVDTLLQHVIERASKEEENDRQFYARYSFTRSKRTDTRDAKGELLKREEKKITHQPTPVPSATKFSEFGEAPEHGEPSPAPPSKPKEGKGRAVEKKDFSFNHELLNRYRFTIAGRETVAGRPMWIMDFAPRSRDLPVNHFKDRFINKAAGRVWIDEAEAVVARADLRLTEEVSFVAGIVATVKACQYSFARERTPDGFWFTRKVDWRLEGREFLVKRALEYHEERSAVQLAR